MFFFFTCEIKKTVTNWNRKCFWTSVVYILWNGLYTFSIYCKTTK